MGRGRFYIKWSYIIYPIGIYIMARVKDPSHFIFYHCKGSNSCGSSCGGNCYSGCSTNCHSDGCYMTCNNWCYNACSLACSNSSGCSGQCGSSSCSATGRHHNETG